MSRIFMTRNGAATAKHIREKLFEKLSNKNRIHMNFENLFNFFFQGKCQIFPCCSFVIFSSSADQMLNIKK